MDIAALKNSTQRLFGSQQRPGPAASATSASSRFEETLAALSSQAVMTRPQAQQAVAMAELAQLQMLQGLFAEDETFEAGSLGRLSALKIELEETSEQQQRVETLYQQLQPSLLDNPAASRSEIESMIEQVAEKVSLAPDLIRSVVTAESAYRPDAVSAAGAQGLMQLMPETAKELGVADSFDPLQNLMGGSRYLKQLLDKYSGDLDKALAAYNWGQGNVDRKGLQQMPRETREYLTKIKGLLTAQA